jgi:hypothetical protein
MNCSDKRPDSERGCIHRPVSSEKNDMPLTNSADLAVPRRPQPAAPTRAAGSAVDLSLRCVWTSHPTHDRSCRSRVPIRVVADAWKRELARGRASEGFFHFAWEGEVWLAYGLPSGRVRGAYCPAHTAQRDEHSAPI